MQDRQHALLSPSGAHRWLYCTPSAMLESKFPNSTSVFAEEGTLAHSYGELMIRFRLGEISEGEFTRQEAVIQDHELFKEEMIHYCNEFADFVISQLMEARSMYSDAKLYLEVKVNLSKYVEGGYGHVDVCIIAGVILWITDFKYGKGKYVEVEKNDQLLLYALGAYHKFRYSHEINRIIISIHQPRKMNVASWETTAEWLMDYVETFIMPQAAKAIKGEGEFVAGEHCTFCRAKGQCKALAEYLDETPKLLSDPALMNSSEVSAILTRLPVIEDWIKGMKEFALLKALDGFQWPGFKIVEGISRRKFTDEAAAMAKLKELEYKQEEYAKLKLKGITDLEKLLTKKKFPEILGLYVAKPPGKPALVSVDDPREPYNKAATFFAGMNFTEDE